MTGMRMVHLGLEPLERIELHFAVRGRHLTPFGRGGGVVQ